MRAMKHSFWALFREISGINQNIVCKEPLIFKESVLI